MGFFELGGVFEAVAKESIDGDVGGEDKRVVENERETKIKSSKSEEKGSGVVVESVVRV